MFNNLLLVITRQQSEYKEWHVQRKFRLMASRFGKIAAMTDRRDINKLCGSIWNAKPLVYSIR